MVQYLHFRIPGIPLDLQLPGVHLLVPVRILWIQHLALSERLQGLTELADSAIDCTTQRWM